MFFVTSYSLLAQQNQVIDNPFYEVKNSGIDNIKKIELTPTQMRLYVHTTFIPNWWVKFPKTTFIQPEGGEKIYATGIEKGEFDKEIYMPASGDSTFVLIFPLLDKTIRTFNYGEEDKTIIWGVSLDKNSKKLQDEDVKKQQQKEKEALAWIESEIGKSKQHAITNFDSPEFFKKENARLVGYIKGYNPKIGKTTGVVYASNQLTREDFPIVVNVHPDGRFEADIPMIYPAVHYTQLLDASMSFYFEPGCTVGATLDWEDFLLADRYRDRRWEIPVKFYGPLADVNSADQIVKLENYNWRNFENEIKTKPPQIFKQSIQELYQRNKDKIAANEAMLSTKAIDILYNTALINYGYVLMDYAGDRDYYAQKDSGNLILKEPFPVDYYDFIQELPANNNIVLSTNSSSSFINRFEYLNVFRSVYMQLGNNTKEPEKTYLDFLIEEENVELSEEEKVIKEYEDLRGGKTALTEEDFAKLQKFYGDNREIINAFYEKHTASLPKYKEKYLDVLQDPNEESPILKGWRLKDSIMVKDLKIQPNLTSQIFKVRELKHIFENMEKSEAEKVMKGMEIYVKNPFLQSEATRIFKLAYPDGETDSYELPLTQSAELFKDIIEPFKGKYILVDFWDIYCGPCIHGIKNMKEKREELKNNPDIEFVFITSTSGSPKDRYDKFVEEQELVHAFRLSDDDYNRMRELFKFNGIPHYETVDRQGHILNKGLSTHNFDYQFRQLMKKEE